MDTKTPLNEEIRSCRLCADRFRATQTAHEPRPVVWFSPTARLLIAGQAPGARVHASGRPFTDPSGDRLREWLGLDEATFYDTNKVALVPMAFCFPGYDKNGSDLPPPTLCAKTWRASVMDALAQVSLTLVIGGYAQKWHIGTAAEGGVTKTVAAWRTAPSGIIPLPHPSWRNTAWIRKNPWFEAELLPELKTRVKEALS